MHIRYDAQLRYKEKKVHDALLHIGGFTDPPMLPALGAPSRFITETRLSSPVRASATFVLRSFQWMNY